MDAVVHQEALSEDSAGESEARDRSRSPRCQDVFDVREAEEEERESVAGEETRRFPKRIARIELQNRFWALAKEREETKEKREFGEGPEYDIRSSARAKEQAKWAQAWDRVTVGMRQELKDHTRAQVAKDALAEG